MEKDYSIDELKQRYSSVHRELDALHKQYGTPMRFSDHLIIGSFLKANGVRLPRGLISVKRGKPFKELMALMAEKHYLAGRLYTVRKEHPEAFPKNRSETKGG